ncbi:DUF1918 domain-containing protein [Egicoccus sp. AB-alg2]|uniref:DUF1918 domain-containing protein n=1 Tax=Egicoccus sp. AB-alg2 TaxID=3242693 RepID=UPI00359D0DE2
MKAHVGDRLLIQGHHTHRVVREAEILEVHGRDGEPPYLVRWSDGHESIISPGADAEIRHDATPPTGR